MAKETKIEWADATWNPWYGCTKVSLACDHCYAESWAKRCGRDFSKVTRAADATFNAPLKWKEPQRIFVCSLSDFFHPSVTHEMYRDAFCVMAATPQHTYMLLTKRPENISKCTFKFGEVLGAWLGVTVENQEQADKRIPELLKIPAAVHFVSCEPLLGPVNLTDIPYQGDTKYRLNAIGRRYGEQNSNSNPTIWGLGGIGLDWVICGGESGGKARPMHPDWARSLRDQCGAAGVPFMFKQWGEWLPIDKPWEQDSPRRLGKNEQWLNSAGGQGFHGKEVYRMACVGKARAGRLLDGVEHNGMPELVENQREGKHG